MIMLHDNESDPIDAEAVILKLANQGTIYLCCSPTRPAQDKLLLVERLLSHLFPPKLGKIEGFETSVTLYLIETGELKVIEPVGSWAGNVLEWPDGRWAKGQPVQKVSSAPAAKITDLMPSPLGVFCNLNSILSQTSVESYKENSAFFSFHSLLRHIRSFVGPKPANVLHLKA